MDWKVLLGLTLGYFIYLVIGAAVFQAIERPTELAQCQEVQVKVTEIRNAIENNSTNITLKDINDLTTILQAAAAYGIEVDENFNVTCQIHWDFQSSFFFSGTVITTIGYGHIAPKTNLGRSICILYAIVGIPLFAMMFSGLGEKIAGLVIKLETRIKGRAKRTWVQKITLTLIVFITFLVFCLLIPSAIFMAVEEWSYHDAFYYSFITITTIGFGDFVVGINPEISYITIYRVLVYFWILFGMAFMATIMSLISDFWKRTGEKARKKTGFTSDDGKEGEERGREEQVDNRGDGDGTSGRDAEANAPEYEEMQPVSHSQESSLSDSGEKHPFNVHNEENGEKHQAEAVYEN